MPGIKVDVPSLAMVLVFTANMAGALWDKARMSGTKTVGEALVVLGSFLFIYTLAYLRSGFFGETEPTLDHLITEGPYGFCRHPLYLSFVILILGLDMMLGSTIGVAFTAFLSIPSAVYRARVEDKLLKEKFGERWERYAERVGLLLPRGFRKNSNDG